MPMSNGVKQRKIEQIYEDDLKAMAQQHWQRMQRGNSFQGDHMSATISRRPLWLPLQ